MPARGRVWRCSRVALLSRMDGALSVGCRNSSGCRRVEVTGASLFGMSCISALFGLVLLRWVLTFCGGLHWLHWSQTRRSDGVSAAAFLHWIYQDAWPIVDTLVLLVAQRVRRLVSLLVCLRPLDSHLFAAAHDRLNSSR